IRIAQAKHRLAKFLYRTFRLHVIAQCPLQPKADRGAVDRKGNFANLTMTDTAPCTIFPDEESDQRPRRSRTVAIEQVQLFRIFKSTCQFDYTQTEKASIEVDIGLNLARNQREVMDPTGHDCNLPRFVAASLSDGDNHRKCEVTREIVHIGSNAHGAVRRRTV